MPGALAGVLFDGLSYGCLLFLIGAGLSVTMGLMNVVNLAHGAFAMLGGYVTVLAMGRWGVPFLAALPLAFLLAAAAGALLERLLYRRLYQASHLDQVLFSIGLTFMAMAAATYFFGPGQQPVRLPDVLRGQVRVGGTDLGVYRLFLVTVVLVLVVLLALLVQRSRFGIRLRAAVDNPDAAAGTGINIDTVFCITFALGSGLAGLGGGLGIEMLGLDPGFPLKYIVYFLLVATMGGAGTIRGPLAAALVLGLCDTAAKYYVPQAGAFAIYALMIALLLVFPAGLFGQRRT